MHVTEQRSGVMADAELAQAVKTLAAECGYVACGITDALPFVEDLRGVEARISRFPEVAALYEDFRRRVDPRSTAPWCESVVVCIRWYGKYRIPESLEQHIGREYLCDCRVKDCPDFVMARKMIEGMRALGMRCKKGGVPDRWAAARAGVARFGKNCFVYTEGVGSWVNIQTWRVDAVLPVDDPTLDSPCPEGCQACVKACPTQALEAPHCMRMDRCIAYLTYGADLPIAPELQRRMGTWVYGCDVCQQVCPLNWGAWREREEAPWLEAAARILSLESLANMDAATYRDVVHPLFWYIPVEDLARWHDNARRALENQAMAMASSENRDER